MQIADIFAGSKTDRNLNVVPTTVTVNSQCMQYAGHFTDSKFTLKTSIEHLADFDRNVYNYLLGKMHGSSALHECQQTATTNLHPPGRVLMPGRYELDILR